MWWMRTSLGAFVSHASQTTDKMCNKTEGLLAGSTKVLCGGVTTCFGCIFGLTVLFVAVFSRFYVVVFIF